MGRSFLRSYCRVAEKEHWCDRCCTPIYPGEQYEASVHVWKRGKITVFKQHLDCEIPPEPDDYDDSEQEEEMPMAA